MKINRKILATAVTVLMASTIAASGATAFAAEENTDDNYINEGILYEGDEDAELPDIELSDLELPDIDDTTENTTDDEDDMDLIDPADAPDINDPAIDPNNPDNYIVPSDGIEAEITDDPFADENVPDLDHVHDLITTEGTPATLFAAGLTDEIECTECGEVIQEQTEIPMLSLTRTLAKGMTGDDVKQVQQKLYELGYLTATPDGSYGAKTQAAVNEFQKANGLASPDGKVGNWTINKLRNNPIAKQSASESSSSDKIVLTRTLKKGMTGDDVLAVQKKLYALGYLTAAPDGSFGGKTETAVRLFQMENGLGYCDGMVGNWTANKLNNDPAAHTKIVLSRTLKKGLSGVDVLAVQNRLYAYGYLRVKPDGSYGKMTETAVSLFQVENGLGYYDGMVGNWTLGKLNGSPAAIY